MLSKTSLEIKSPADIGSTALLALAAKDIDVETK
jgi:hypothetical protein